MKLHFVNLIASRKGLFIIDLEDPYASPRELHHLTKWEVADVQWNPHQSRHNWVASSVSFIFHRFISFIIFIIFLILISIVQLIIIV
jgi:hypothetical protein